MTDAWQAAVRKGLVDELLRPARLARDVERGVLGQILGRSDWPVLRYGAVPPSRAPHLSKLDEESLAKIATEGQGTYVRATADDRDVEHIVSAMQSLSSRAVSGELRFNLVNRYQWPLAVAVLCFMLEGLWLVLMPYARDRWQRRQRAKEDIAYV